RIAGRLLTRRGVLAGVAGAVSAPAISASLSAAPPADPFVLGVAAGDPTADGFVLWTRLAPDPLSSSPQAPGGMLGGDVTVTYEIGVDPQLRRVVRRGEATAEAAFAHSVHLDVKGLEPARPYWYRFRHGNLASRVGRALTLPTAESNPARLKLAVASCANYEQGYFAAYRHLTDEAPDLVLFLGDYIYESIDRGPGTVRRHSDGVEAATLLLYRNRYAQYRLDPDLQRLHAELTTLMTWDDHEVQNDYADRWSITFDDPRQFLERRAAAYRAFYEHMPLRPSRSRPNGPNMRVYDRISWGSLASLFMLDGRQYRSRGACYAPPKWGGGHLESNESCPERLAWERSMLGGEQEAWLSGELSRSKSRWNVIAQDVLMAQLKQRAPDGAAAFWTDAWDGYPAARQRLLTHLYEARVNNPVVLSGDIHSFWVSDLKLNF